jgi:hypothetical protein
VKGPIGLAREALPKRIQMRRQPADRDDYERGIVDPAEHDRLARFLGLVHPKQAKAATTIHNSRGRIRITSGMLTQRQTTDDGERTPLCARRSVFRPLPSVLRPLSSDLRLGVRLRPGLAAVPEAEAGEHRSHPDRRSNTQVANVIGMTTLYHCRCEGQPASVSFQWSLNRSHLRRQALSRQRTPAPHRSERHERVLLLLPIMCRQERSTARSVRDH